MKAGSLLAVLVGFIACAFPTVAVADGPWDFEFVYPESASQGRIAIPDNSVQWFALTATADTLLNPKLAGQPIQEIQFEISGLAHDAPMDINLILLDPYGGGLTLMDEAGDGHALVLPGIDIVFAQTGIPLPHDGGAIEPNTDYLPDGPGSLSEYKGEMLDPNLPWYVVVIDDDSSAEGSFESMTLRGVVPEPATLSLLALGAVFLTAGRRRS